MRPVETITLTEIIKLFKTYLGVTIPRTSIYWYVHHKGFPTNSGLGRPRRWPKKKVLAWIKKQQG